MSDASGNGSILPFFFSSFSWNFALGMTYPLVPLYANQLGMSGVGIGTLVALPVLAQITFNLIGGAYTDQVGGRRLMLASFLLTAGAGAVFFFAAGFWLLLLAQLLMVMSRAMYWPASWSLGSELPGGRSLQALPSCYLPPWAPWLSRSAGTCRKKRKARNASRGGCSRATPSSSACA
jgi:MFS family permease